MVGRYTEEEIWTFGEVIGRLADVIEIAARAIGQASSKHRLRPDECRQKALPSMTASMLRAPSFKIVSGSPPGEIHSTYA